MLRTVILKTLRIVLSLSLSLALVSVTMPLHTAALQVGDTLSYGDLIYSQNFSSGTVSDLFSQTSGLSLVTDGGAAALQIVGGTGALAFLKDKTPWASESEYIVSAEFKIKSTGATTNNNAAGIAFGTDTSNYYHQRFEATTDNSVPTKRLQLIAWFNGTAESSSLRQNVSYSFNYDVPYKMSAVVRGRTVDVYINDKYCLSKTYDANIPNSYIGFRSYNCTAVIKNMSVHRTATVTNPSEPLTAVLSKTSGVETDNDIEVVFNAPVDPLTIDGISLKKDDVPVVADIRISEKDATGRTVIISPSRDLDVETTYTVEISGDVFDLYGNFVENPPLVLPFSTMKNSSMSVPLTSEEGHRITWLNGNWKFKIDPDRVGEEQGWQTADTSNWDNITVPGNWETLNEYSDYHGIGWYSRTFTVPVEQAGYPAYLHVERAYHDAVVYINGQRVGKHSNGYADFEFRIDSLLNYGGQNTVAISVDNTYGWGVNTIAKGDTAIGAWFKWGGISGDVSLVAHNTARFVWQHIIPKVNLSDMSGTVDIQYKLTNTELADSGYTVVSDIYDKATGEFVATISKAAAISGESEVTVSSRTLSIDDVKLWDYDYPNLYTVKTRLLNMSGVVIDTISDNIGFRKFELTGTQALLNGKPIRATGANRVWDSRAYGQTEPLHVLMRDVDYMKSMGMNMGRVSHAPMDKALLEYCDEVGFLLIGEAAVWGDQNPNVFGENKAKDWYAEMINKDFNHPSIVAWGIANEIRGHHPESQAYSSYMRDFVLQLDPTRYITEPSNTASGNATDSARYSDFISRNSYGSFGNTASSIYNTFKRPIFFTEYGITQNTETLDASTVDFQSMIDDISKTPAVFGAAVWTLNDYRSIFEGTNASQNRTWGVTTVWGNQKASFKQLRAASTPVKSLALTLNDTTNEPGSEIRATVSFEIKPSTAIPAYPMHGYKLKVEMRDMAGAVTGGQVIDLPNIEPKNPGNSGRFTLSLTVPAQGLMYVRASIVNPGGYEISETVQYCGAPLEAPVIKDIAPTATGVRVTFSHVEGATSYKVSYGTTSFSYSKDASLNNYVDITGLTGGTAYQFRVAAVNSAGQTVSDIRYATPSGASNFAPKIIHVEPVAGGFYIGYTSDGWTPLPGGQGWTPEKINAQNIYYEVEYGKNSGIYDVRRTGIKTQGAYYVDALENGQTYYCRMRYVKDGVPSAWSEELTVTTEEPVQPPAVPLLWGGVSGADYVSLSFNPVAKATGYIIKYGLSPDNPDSSISVNRAYVNQAMVNGLLYGKTYYFSIAAQRDGAISEYTAPVAVTVEIESQPSANVRTNQLIYAMNWNTRPLLVDLFTNDPNGSTFVVNFENVPSGVTVAGDEITVAYGENKTVNIPVTVDETDVYGKYPMTVVVRNDGKIITQKDVVLHVVGSGAMLYEPFEPYTPAEWQTIGNGSASVSVVEDSGDDKLEIKQTAGSSYNAAIITGDSQWRDYTIESDISYIGNAMAGLVFRYSEDGSFYHIRLNGGNLIEIYAFKPSAELLYSTVLPKEITSINKLHYKIVNAGDSAKFYINDIFITALSGLNIGNHGGKVGYRVHGLNSIVVDNLLVYATVEDIMTVNADVEMSEDIASVVVNITNNTDEKIDAFVLAALYDESGMQLLSVESDIVQIDSTGSYDFDFDMKKIPAGYQFKVYVWDPVSIEPLVNAIEL